MIYFALICSILAVASGLKVVGSGRDWSFTLSDLKRGRENALAYVWVSLSTMFSIAHACVIAFWIYIDGPAIVGSQHTAMWMTFHAGMGLLFTAAHLFLKSKLKNERGQEPRFLWSK